MITLLRELHDPPVGVRSGRQPLYAIGDVHGCYDLLHALLAEIARDAASRYPHATPMLILCGDYVDRGPASSKVLAALAWLMRSNAVEARLLEGNHEAMMRMFIENPVQCAEWITFGGRQTLQSYGVAVPDIVDTAAMLCDLRDALLDVIPASHYSLLQRTELMVQAGDYTFVHAGVRPGVPLKKQAHHDLLWIRDEFLEHSAPAKGVIVHGHTWVGDRPMVLPHRIGIDTGAYETGVLTGLRIDDEAIEILQAVRAGGTQGCDPRALCRVQAQLHPPNDTPSGCLPGTIELKHA